MTSLLLVWAPILEKRSFDSATVTLISKVSQEPESYHDYPVYNKNVRTNIHNKTVNLLIVRSDTRKKKTVVTRIFFVIQIHYYKQINKITP